MPAGVISLSSHISVNRPAHHVCTYQGSHTPSAAIISTAGRVAVTHAQGSQPGSSAIGALAGSRLGRRPKLAGSHLRIVSSCGCIEAWHDLGCCLVSLFVRMGLCVAHVRVRALAVLKWLTCPEVVG